MEHIIRNNEQLPIKVVVACGRLDYTCHEFMDKCIEKDLSAYKIAPCTYDVEGCTVKLILDTTESLKGLQADIFIGSFPSWFRETVLSRSVFRSWNQNIATMDDLYTFLQMVRDILKYRCPEY